MSWKPQVKTGSDPKWYGNALAFASKAEAEQSAYDLMCRWMAVTDYRAVESTDPVTHVLTVDGRTIRLPPEVDCHEIEAVEKGEGRTNDPEL